jgi:Ulp1 family protease
LKPKHDPTAPLPITDKPPEDDDPPSQPSQTYHRLLEIARSQIEVLLPLTKEDDLLVAQEFILRPGDKKTIVSHYKEAPLMVIHENFLTLLGGKWVKDEALMAFLAVVFKGKANCKAFLPHFFTRATGLASNSSTLDCKNFAYGGVAKWGRKIDPKKSFFSLEHLFFPINIEMQHWVMSYIHIPSHRIFYFDSLGGDGTKFQNLLLGYIQMEFAEVFPGETFPPDWKVIPWDLTKGPRQLDGYNCGVYVCFVAELLACFSVPPEVLFGGKLEISKSDADGYRYRMAATILRGVIPPIVDLPCTFTIPLLADGSG